MKISQDLLNLLRSTIQQETIVKFQERLAHQQYEQEKKSSSNAFRNMRRNSSRRPRRSSSRSRQQKNSLSNFSQMENDDHVMKRSKQLSENKWQNEDSQNPTKRESPDVVPRRHLKDKAVFVHSAEIPYLHSTDLLNHLYKKNALSQKQRQGDTPLYNPPADNAQILARLKCVHLYYCKIQSLRDMGTGWSNLQQLSVYFGRLMDLSGLGAFPAIEYLNCPYNMIQHLSEAMFHPTLVSIDLEQNLIGCMEEVEHLFSIEQLEYVNLDSNPIMEHKESRRIIEQKFDKIIEIEHTKFDEYLNGYQRDQWEYSNYENVEACNSLLRQFFAQARSDEITIHEKCLKWRQQIKDQQELVLNQEPSSSSSEKPLVEYIPPQVPQNLEFQLENLEDHEDYCQEKISLRKLNTFIDTKEKFIGPVLEKYLRNKLVIKEECKRKETRNPVFQGDKQKAKDQPIENSERSLELKKPSKLIRVSRLAQTGFSQTLHSKEKSVDPKKKQMSSTTSSMTTNNTESQMTKIRRNKLSFGKSQQKSLSKVSVLSSKVEDQKISKISGLSEQSQVKSTLIRQNRLLLATKHKGNNAIKNSVKKLQEMQTTENEHEKTSMFEREKIGLKRQGVFKRGKRTLFGSSASKDKQQCQKSNTQVN